MESYGTNFGIKDIQVAVIVLISKIEIANGLFDEFRRLNFFTAIRNLSQEQFEDGEDGADSKISNEGWLELFEHLRMINDQVSVLDLTMREELIYFVYELVLQDPNTRLPLLKNTTKQPPSYDLLQELDLPFMISRSQHKSVSDTAMNLLELVSWHDPDFLLSQLLGSDQISRDIFQKKAFARVWNALNSA